MRAVLRIGPEGPGPGTDGSREALSIAAAVPPILAARSRRTASVVFPFLGPRRINPVVVENDRRGGLGWQLGRDEYQVADDIHGQIKGYASAPSVEAGEPITFHVSVNPAQPYRITIFRLGWYEKLGGRFIERLGPFDGSPQPPCSTDKLYGLVECQWAASYTLVTGPSWLSGVYLAVLSNAQRYENDIPFVVRNDGRRAALLVQIPVATYQAYNDYPSGTTGTNLYHVGSIEPQLTEGTRAVEVSFDRPYRENGASRFIDEGDIRYVRWLERSGYNVTYATDVDVDQDPEMLPRYRGVIVIGHSEYWSKAMYDAALRARDAGVGFAFFGANDVFRQIRFRPVGPAAVGPFGGRGSAPSACRSDPRLVGSGHWPPGIGRVSAPART